MTEPLAAGTIADLIVVLDEDHELIASRRLRCRPNRRRRDALYWPV